MKEVKEMAYKSARPEDFEVLEALPEGLTYPSIPFPGLISSLRN